MFRVAALLAPGYNEPDKLTLYIIKMHQKSP